MISILCPAFAHTLTPEQAIARLIDSRHTQSRRLVSLDRQLRLQRTIAMPDSELAAIYIFADGKRSLIVAADDCAAPLLGYVDNACNLDRLPPAMEYWLDEYSRQISRAAAMGVGYTADNDDYPSIEPLVASRWDQRSPYNADCPRIGGRPSVTGCVATAMAQIMNYHRWPERANGTIDYTAWTYDLHIQCNLDDFVFDWENMCDTYGSSSSAAQKAAVARLMYACGVSVEMDYGPTVSGAFQFMARKAFVNNFSYSPAATYLERGCYTRAQWNELVYNQLSLRQPVFYGGVSRSGVAHAFVCDGYSSDGFFHINWGYSGSGDGYFLLSALGKVDSAYDYYQGVIIDIRPPRDGDRPALIFSAPNGFTTDAVSVGLGDEVCFAGPYFNSTSLVFSGCFGYRFTPTDGQSFYAEGPTVSNFTDDRGMSEFSVLIPTDLTDGRYSLCPAVRESGSDLWTDMVCGVKGPRVEMTVSDGRATFVNIDGVRLSVSDWQLSPVVQSRPSNITATITNTGVAEYSGDIRPALVDADGRTIVRGTGKIVYIPAGGSIQYSYDGVLAYRDTPLGPCGLTLYSEDLSENICAPLAVEVVDKAAIDEIVDDPVAGREVYDLRGIKLTKPFELLSPGLYIVRSGQSPARLVRKCK